MATTKKSATKQRKSVATTPKNVVSKAQSPSEIATRVGLRVRMYRVGFGDFFLLTVTAPDGSKHHVLIDCGVTPGTTHAGDIGTIKEAVADMARETDNKLALIIATHRHMDHIIGFSRCEEIFKAMTVDAIWMSYWESEYDQQAQPTAAKKFQDQLTANALVAQQRLALAAGSSIEVDAILAMLYNATGLDPTAGQQSALAATAAGVPTGKGGGSNPRSLALLKGGLGPKPEYYKNGDEPKLPQSLVDAGLTAEILGPPPADAVAFLQLTDLQKGVGQYLGESGSEDSDKFDPFGTLWHATSDDYPKRPFGEFSGVAALQDAVKASQPSALLTAVKKLDDCLNNQSLVVLFKFGGKNLLFAGDAQGGNWEYWMYGGTPDKAPSIDKISPEGKRILTQLDFYKVGHHGSTNATPVSAVDAMSGSFVSMCSTQEKTYGTLSKGTEVPRLPLLEALAKKSSVVVRSDQIAVAAGGGIPAVSAPPDLPSSFELGAVYIDYNL